MKKRQFKSNRKKRTFQRHKICRFCADSNLAIDYKDYSMLRFFVTERGKIIPRKEWRYYPLAASVQDSSVMRLLPSRSVVTRRVNVPSMPDGPCLLTSTFILTVPRAPLGKGIVCVSSRTPGAGLNRSSGQAVRTDRCLKDLAKALACERSNGSSAKPNTCRC